MADKPTEEPMVTEPTKTEGDVPKTDEIDVKDIPL